MKKATLFIFYLAISAVCFAQHKAGSGPQEAKNFSFAPGAGFEVDFSQQSINYSVPVELRLFSVRNRFNFSLGERITFHHAKPDKNLYEHYLYYSSLRNPYIEYKQFATYVDARWNIIAASDTGRGGLFAGVAYLLCLNADGRVLIDVPPQGPWEGAAQSVYDWKEGAGWQEYRCDQLLRTISHSLRAELGFTTEAVELSIFGLLSLTNPVDESYADRTLYFDRNHKNSQLTAVPVTHADGDTPYLPLRLTGYRNVAAGLDEHFTWGFSMKVFVVPTYYKNLFARRR